MHPDCGAARPFDIKTQIARVKYWLTAKCSSTIFLKGRCAFGRDRTHKTRYTLPRPLVVLVGVQRNLESPFFASSTYIVPYKKPLIMQETTKMPRNYYHLHTWKTSDKTTLSTIVHALTNQPYQETTTSDKKRF